MIIMESVLAKVGLTVLVSAAVGTALFWPSPQEGGQPSAPSVQASTESPEDPVTPPFAPDLTWFGVPKDPNRPVPAAVGTISNHSPLPAAAPGLPAPPGVTIGATVRPAQPPTAAVTVAPAAPAPAAPPPAAPPPLIGVGADVSPILGVGLGVG